MEFKSLVPWRDNKKQLPATHGDYADPFAMFRREMSRVFDDVFDGAGRGLGPVAGGWQGITPTIDVAETEKEVVVTAELPGLEDKDFEVTLAGDVLTIKGEKKAEHEQKSGDAYYMERRFGSFSRSMRLPFEARDEKVDAKYEIRKGRLDHSRAKASQPTEVGPPHRREGGVTGRCASPSSS